MAHSDNACGAVTGALTVIGMKYGRTRLDVLVAKEKAYTMANAFMMEFLRRNHSLNCKASHILASASPCVMPRPRVSDNSTHLAVYPPSA